MPVSTSFVHRMSSATNQLSQITNIILRHKTYICCHCKCDECTDANELYPQQSAMQFDGEQREQGVVWELDQRTFSRKRNQLAAPPLPRDFGRCAFMIGRLASCATIGCCPPLANSDLNSAEYV